MTEPNQASTPFIQNILLDTCILQYFNNKNIGTELKKYLIELIDRKFDLVISEITIAELLTNLSHKDETEGIKILDMFNRYRVEDRILIEAALLSSIYNQVGITNYEKILIYGDKISLADKIIGATAILAGSLILTANISDFPSPYFIPTEEKKILYKKKDRESMLYLQLLSPNTQLINDEIGKRA